MDTLALWQWAALAAASALVGFSKSAVSGANTISLAVFAAVLPARESTGVLLPIPVVGDVLAVLLYRRHAHWPTLLRLFPAVAVGVVAGCAFLIWADDAAIRVSIGAILLFMAAVTVWRRLTTTGARGRCGGRPRATPRPSRSPLVAAGEGRGVSGRRAGEPGQMTSSSICACSRAVPYAEGVPYERRATNHHTVARTSTAISAIDA